MPDVNDENKLFVCGTGGYAPIKYSIHVSNYEEIYFPVNVTNPLKHIVLVSLHQKVKVVDLFQVWVYII